jgi:hypothetical protein
LNEGGWAGAQPLSILTKWILCALNIYYIKLAGAKSMSSLSRFLGSSCLDNNGKEETSSSSFVELAISQVLQECQRLVCFWQGSSNNF